MLYLEREKKTMQKPPKKKIFKDNPLLSIPIALGILSLGALLVFGTAKILTMERTYKDLVREMQSKTFGNKWVSALELSKLIASSSLKDEDIPWLIDNLSALYKTSPDPRTRSFILAAMGALRDPRAGPVLFRGLDDENGHVQFHAIVGIANIDHIEKADWPKLESFLHHQDTALVHSALLALATHRIESSEIKILEKLSDSERSIRYAAATALITYKNEAAVSTLQEILGLSMDRARELNLDKEKLFGLKINVLNAIQKSRWKALKRELEIFVEREKHLTLISQAKTILEIL